MPDDPTEEVIKREIAEAARILREDGHSVRLSKIEEKLNKHFPDEPEKVDDPDAPPGPPDKKDPPNTGDDRRKKSIWWGELDDNSGESQGN